MEEKSWCSPGKNRSNYAMSGSACRRSERCGVCRGGGGGQRVKGIGLVCKAGIWQV